MKTQIREAVPADAPHIAALIHELALSIGETSPIAPAYVLTYLGFPGCHILLAEQQGQIAGLLSYSIRPNLYHQGDTALIEELIVRDAWRGKGLGSALMRELLTRLEAAGCIELSVTTMPDNDGAIRFYHVHGLVDEAIYLEKHFVTSYQPGEPG
jgi:ribosomal protein S18 acetylase RimI-like enzyme